MFVEVFHSTIKDIHLTLEVKTSFGNSTPTMSSSTESSTYFPGLPLTTVIDIARKKRRVGTFIQKLQSKA
jgi:hypothetical protein